MCTRRLGAPHSTTDWSYNAIHLIADGEVAADEDWLAFSEEEINNFGHILELLFGARERTCPLMSALCRRQSGCCLSNVGTAVVIQHNFKFHCYQHNMLKWQVCGCWHGSLCHFEAGHCLEPPLRRSWWSRHCHKL